MPLTIDELASILGMEVPDEDSTDWVLLNTALRTAWSDITTFLKFDPQITDYTEYLPNWDFQNSILSTTGYTSQNGMAFLERDSSPGLHHTRLQLSHTPVRQYLVDGTTPIKVFEDTSAQNDWADAFDADTEIQDFSPNFSKQSDIGSVCEDGILERINGSWTGESCSIKVVYAAGYTADEIANDFYGIVSAMITEASKRVHQISARQRSSAGFTGPLKSEKLGDYSYSTNSTIQNELQSTSGSGGSALSPSSKAALLQFVNFGALYAK